jgi:hypothetical protein
MHISVLYRDWVTRRRVQRWERQAVIVAVRVRTLSAHIPPIHSRSLQRLYKENHQRTLLAGPPAPDLLELLLGVAADSLFSRSAFLARAAAPARVVLAGVAAAAAAAPGLADRLAAVSEAVAAGRRLEAAAPFFFLAAARGKRSAASLKADKGGEDIPFDFDCGAKSSSSSSATVSPSESSSSPSSASPPSPPSPSSAPSPPPSSSSSSSSSSLNSLSSLSSAAASPAPFVAVRARFFGLGEAFSTVVAIRRFFFGLGAGTAAAAVEEGPAAELGRPRLPFLVEVGRSVASSSAATDCPSPSSPSPTPLSPSSRSGPAGFEPRRTCPGGIET